jgi:hypothetical protein
MKIDKAFKFVVLESTLDGSRYIAETDKTIGGKLYEVCGYANTRDACITMLLLLAPSKYRKAA